jgi:hypothetical protein
LWGKIFGKAWVALAIQAFSFFAANAERPTPVSNSEWILVERWTLRVEHWAFLI